MPTREDAWNLLCEYTESDSLRRHGLAVEQVMRKMAQKYGEDEELWAMTGLLHDFDYEKYPTMEEHPFVGNKILKENGYPEELTTAIMGHANYTGVPRESLMAKALYAVDEICGFMFAVTYVRPSKSIHDVKVKSVKKKLKQKSFAASVNREEVYEGPEELDVTLDEHIQFIIDALKEKAEDLGLSGEGVSG
ncbi:MAG: HDIG domain-containing protein [Candidatus Marinimicrobia bacterium]|jgi:putative nucleotidyltransferase with HDIG domain|nr:HDIG domain-containing protein [Candidatus Neomarinimicrobiota bacterium]MDP7060557.1 HDIG domain-containing protein [Candidatus Neomarinimicrobiota bacterium]|tara:strand:+ start:205 stop:780 length:576 start_codon:yes stop_codon:yes gene_type:complete